MNPKYPDDYYDDIRESREIRLMKISIFVMGFGCGIMATVAFATLYAWAIGI